jgi:hypothetical protein
MKVARFRDPIFDSSILLTFGPMSEMNIWYKKHKFETEINPHWQAFSEVMNYSLKEGVAQVQHLHFTRYNFSSIVHETNHAAYDILSARGISFVLETKEVFAYYQDWLAGRVRDYLEKWTHTKKRKKKL